MKKQNKFKLLFAIFLLTSVLCFVSAAAEHGGSFGNITWTLSDEGVLTISGSGEINQNPWHIYCSDIKEIIIEQGIIVLMFYV